MVNTIQYEGVTLLVNNKGQIFYESGKELEPKRLRNRRTGYENPYLYITLYSPTKKKSMRVQVSRLVCMAFHPIENPEDYQCDHRDNNP